MSDGLSVPGNAKIDARADARIAELAGQPIVDQYRREGDDYIDGMKLSAGQTPTAIMPISSIGDGEVLLANGPASEHVLPLCLHGGYLYGVDSNATKVYRTADGDAWTQQASLSGVQNMWSVSATAIIAFTVDHKLHRSTDGGANWTQVAALGANSGARQWSLKVSPGGTAIYAEYSGEDTEANVVNLWRATSADDFVTWTNVYSTTAGEVRHFHAVGYQVATSTWVVSAEMRAGKTALNAITASTDDGLNWTPTLGQRDLSEQPTDFLDYGHPTRLMVGGDRYEGCGYYDVTSHALGTFTPNWRAAGTNDYKYVYGLYHNAGTGLFYAAQRVTDTAPRYPIIQVSSDLVHWTTIHRFGMSDGGIYWWAGELNGKIYGTITYGDLTSHRGFRITPPSIASLIATALRPSATNACTENGSSAETSVAMTKAAGNGTIAQDTTEGLHGSACNRFTHAADGSDAEQTYGPTAAVTNGDRQVFSCYVKGTTGGILQTYQKATGGSPTQYAAIRYFPVCEDRWTRLSCAALLVDGGNNLATPLLKNNSCAGVNAVNVDLKFDCFTITKNGIPDPFLLGGTSRSRSKHAESIHVSDTWTHVFAWWPSYASCDASPAAGTKLYIRSWKIGPNCTAQLYWDPADNNRFNLEVTNGIHTETLYTASVWFLEDSPLLFAVGIDADGKVQMLYSEGGTVATATRDGSNAGTANTYDFHLGLLRSHYGDVNETNGTAGLFATIWYSDGEPSSTLLINEVNSAITRNAAW